MAESSFFTHIVVCDGGLNTQTSSLRLGRQDMNGFAATLINFEPWKGYRRISGCSVYGDSAGLTSYSSAQTRGVAVYNGKVLQARDTSSSLYTLYARAPADSSWSVVASGLSYTTGGRVRHTQFNWAGQKIVFVDGTGYARSWDGASIVVINGGGAPANPSLVTTFRSRLVLSGYSARPYAVSISKPNDETDFSNATAIELNAGDTVVAVKTFREQLYIFCENSIKKVTGTSSSDFAVIPVTSNLGCCSPDSIFELSGDLYFWSADGIRTIRGTDRVDDIEIGPISIRIRPTLKNLSTQYDARKIITGVVREKTQFRLYFSDSSYTENRTRGIIGGFNTPEESGNDPDGVKRFEFGELLGLNPSCMANGFINGVEYVVTGGFDGVVYLQESGNTFAGRAIPAVYKTPYMDLQDPFVRKTLHRLLTFIEPEGDCTIYTGVSFDYGTSDVVQPGNIQSDFDYTAAIYGMTSSTYGTAVYGSAPQQVALDHVQGSCKTVALTIVSVDDQASFGIQGFMLEYANEGRA